MLFTPQKVSFFQDAFPEKRYYIQISFLKKHSYFLGLLGCMLRNSLLNFAVLRPFLFKYQKCVNVGPFKFVTKWPQRIRVTLQ